MSHIDWTTVAQWLRTTIPGIIVLGALGSILAVLVLKLLSRFTRRFFASAYKRFTFFAFRRFAFSALICDLYLRERRWPHLTIFITAQLISLTGKLILVALCLLATAFIVVRLGVQAPAFLATLVAVTGILLLMLLRNAISVAGIWAVLFHREHQDVKKQLQDRDTFTRLTDQIVRDIQSGVQPSPQPPPPPSDQSGGPLNLQPQPPPTDNAGA